jgi:hypothetical protein
LIARPENCRRLAALLSLLAVCRVPGGPRIPWLFADAKGISRQIPAQACAVLTDCRTLTDA